MILMAILATTIAYGALLAIGWAFRPAYAMDTVKTPVMRENLTMEAWVMKTVKNAGLNEHKVWTLIFLESSWNPEAMLVNKDKSVDLGLFQINTKYHPEVSKACSLDYKCQTFAAIEIIKKRGFKEWVAAKNIGLK